MPCRTAACRDSCPETGRRILSRVVGARAARSETDRGVRREDMDDRRAHAVGELAERRNAVEHPHRAAMRGGNEIAAVDMKIANRGPRQIELQWLPVRAVVGREVDARLRAGVEQTAPHRIFANRARVRAVGDAGRDLRPRLSEIGGLVQVRLEVVLLVAIGRDVRGRRVKVRWLDDRYAGVRTGERRRHFRPRLAPVA